MDFFESRDGSTFAESVDLAKIAADFGTPTYVYSRATISRHCRRLLDAFSGYPTTACFAVKANSNIAYLKEVFALGFGADIVSQGELERCDKAGVDPRRVVFSGVGKKAAEISRGLEFGIRSFNVESLFELERIESVAAELGKVAPISFRVNPNIDAKTHPKISTGLYSTKFGMQESEVKELVESLGKYPSCRLVGLACHIGSQITELTPLADAAARMSALVDWVRAKGIELETIDMGGGLGIRYRDELPPSLESYAETLIAGVKATGLELFIEPGRVVAGNTGVLLTEVEGVKHTPKKSFVVVDASMTELMRPALYGSYHEILPVKSEAHHKAGVFDVVGPVCESTDVLGTDRRFGEPKIGDLMLVRACGGYGAAMMSNYNSRPRAAEVLVDGDDAKLIRRRESLEDLWAHEIYSDG